MIIYRDVVARQVSASADRYGYWQTEVIERGIIRNNNGRHGTFRDQNPLAAIKNVPARHPDHRFCVSAIRESYYAEPPCCVLGEFKPVLTSGDELNTIAGQALRRSQHLPL